MPRSIHSPEYRKLTAVLLEARLKSGMTQQQVADRLGKPQSYVAKIEGNERRIDVVEFITLANALDVVPHSLFNLILSEIDTPK